MDGAEVKVLTNVERYSIGGIAVDYNTSFVYWTDLKRNAILQCDLDGNNRRTLNLLLRHTPRAIAALGNIVYWQEEWSVLYRSHVENEKIELLLNGTKFKNLELISSHGAIQHSVANNPCANNSCSHICIQSSHKQHRCRCGDDYMFHEDGHTCIRKPC